LGAEEKKNSFAVVYKLGLTSERFEVLNFDVLTSGGTQTAFAII
jgi:hypothetical protein